MRFSLALLAVLALGTSAARAENWPQWRGPAGDGVSHEQNLPIAWSEKQGLAWKTPLPAWGDSTPAIWGNAVFVTSHHDGDLLLLKLDKRTGRVEWTKKVGAGTAPRKATIGKAKFHRLHNLASPSPVTDGKTVVVHFGNGDLAAYDFQGKQLWKRNLQDDFGPYTIWWGHANSPVLYGDLVISVCMQDSLAEKGEPPRAKSYLVAHDLKTGARRWYADRHTEALAEQCDSYTTPILWKHAGRTELVVMGGNQLDAYDPATGARLWYLPNLVGGRTITGPTAGKHLIYATQGQRGPLLAVKPTGAGELSRDAIVWSDTQGTPDSCCPVLWGDLLFTVSDDGIARCFDALTGHLQWKKRLRGDYKASPVAADGRVYFLNTKGLCTVISAGARFDKLTENQLDDATLASPAISDGHIFIRGHEHLYCIGK